MIPPLLVGSRMGEADQVAGTNSLATPETSGLQTTDGE
ncbi:MAG: hypothetical protein RLZZ214_2063 [Verrucomicrobiota bacterium]|jgi:hypothetical protein